MEYRTLELILDSAKDLKDLNLFSKMDVYAVVSLSGHHKIKTPVDRNAGTNPTWNFPVKFTFSESLARQNRLSLEINLHCERTLAADKDIGQVHVPLRELLDQAGDGKSFQHVSYQVRKPSGKPQGAFNFSYKFADKFAAPAKASASASTSTSTSSPAAAVTKVEPVTAYPAPVVGSTSAPYPIVYPQPQYAGGYGYPPPPAQAGYAYAPQPAHAYPAQAGYGYPAQAGYGYGYPPPPRAPAKNKFGMGLGAGLLGGALGGLLIGDIISDVAFDDAFGGFDF
ncbi:protein SRC2 [Cajanus cajan]|uniref:C2 domain-containing protein n=1 Tax=Cajanus cajan TaxID=3821 RepID=A0A151STF4_CAJCA|nr:protein SRC2 [Cajanus cajan]KYP58083.1 hypothetical protein KK1_004374 [Cajanus cajan]